ncbi:hypothetical protein Esti_000277 [Eimeria stiedai]
MGANQSQPWKDGNTRLFWGVCAVLGAAAVFYCTRSSSSSGSSNGKTVTDAELIQVLRAVTKEFHKIFAEAAQMAYNLLSTLQLRGKDANPRTVRETVETMTMHRMFLARLEAAEASVVSSFGLRPEQFNDKCAQLAKTNLEVKQLVAGLKQMDKELSSVGASEEVTQKLQQTNTDAEASVLQEEQLLLQHEQEQQQQQQQVVLTPVVFLQAVALHCRDPEFKAKKVAIDQTHSERIFNLLKAGRSKRAAEPFALGFAVQSSWPELSLRLESCEGSGACLLCLVAPRNGSKGSSGDVDAPLSLLAEFSAFLDDAERKQLRLDSLATVCLDSLEMPAEGEAYSPIRAAVGRKGHCFALFKGKDLQDVADEVDFFKERIKEALGSSNSETSTNDSSSSSSDSSSSNDVAAETPEKPTVARDAAAAAGDESACGSAGAAAAAAAAGAGDAEEEVEAVTAAETFPSKDPVAAVEAAGADDALASENAAKRAASPPAAAEANKA